jgi:hypothetical protein
MSMMRNSTSGSVFSRARHVPARAHATSPTWNVPDPGTWAGGRVGRGDPDRQIVPGRIDSIGFTRVLRTSLKITMTIFTTVHPLAIFAKLQRYETLLIHELTSACISLAVGGTGKNHDA